MNHNLKKRLHFGILQKVWPNYKNIRGLLVESLAGTERDFTSGSLRQAVFILSVPMILELIMESVFAIVDIFFVSKLGAGAVATVGITESLITIMYSICFGLATATSAIVSRRIGEKNSAGAANAAAQAIITGLAISFVIAIPGAYYAPDLLRLMGASESIVRDYSGYTRWMFGGNVVIMMLFIINSIFRSAGAPAISMRVLWMANLLNIILDPLLIFGIGPFPELGINGAAIATNIGRGVAVLYQFYLLYKGTGRICLRGVSLKPDFPIIWKIIRLSIGAIGQNLIATLSWIGLMRIVSSFGSEVVAGYTIAIRIIMFALLPSWGMSNAASTLVGQNLGAKQPERAEKSVWVSAKLNILAMGLIGAALAIFPDFWISLFIKEPEVLAVGEKCLRILSFGFLAYGPGMILVHAINGAGDTVTPTKINVACFWLFEIPLAYSLALLADLNESGVFYAIVAAESALTICAALVFKRGKWKEQIV